MARVVLVMGAARVNEPILVRPTGPMGWMPPETVDSLIEALRAEGLDARISYDEIPGGGMGPTEFVFLWIAAEASKAIIQNVVGLAVEWMRERYRQDPEDKRLKGAHIILYEGDEGKVSEIIELESVDAEPIRKSPEDFQRYTQNKPPEGIRRWKGRNQ